MALIDRDAVLEEMLFRCNQEIAKHKTMRRALGDVGRAAYDSVKNAPTIDAEPVRHGRWIHDINNLYGCSECTARETMSHRNMKNFCPWCGAKMDAEVQDDQ